MNKAHKIALLLASATVTIGSKGYDFSILKEEGTPFYKSKTKRTKPQKKCKYAKKRGKRNNAKNRD